MRSQQEALAYHLCPQIWHRSLETATAASPAGRKFPGKPGMLLTLAVELEVATPSELNARLCEILAPKQVSSWDLDALSLGFPFVVDTDLGS